MTFILRLGYTHSNTNLYSELIAQAIIVYTVVMNPILATRRSMLMADTSKIRWDSIHSIVNFLTIMSLFHLKVTCHISIWNVSLKRLRF